MAIKKERHCIACGNRVYKNAPFCGYCGEPNTIATVLDLPPFLYKKLKEVPYRGKRTIRILPTLVILLILFSTFMSGGTTPAQAATTGLSEAQITTMLGQTTWWVIKGENRAVQALVWDGYKVDGAKLKSIQYNKQTFLPGSTVHTVAGDDAATYWLQGTVDTSVMSNPGTHADRAHAVPAQQPAVSPTQAPAQSQQPTQANNGSRSSYSPYADYRAPGAVWDIWWPVPQDLIRVCVIAPSINPNGTWSPAWKTWVDAGQKPALRSVAGTCYAYDAAHANDAHYDYDHTQLQAMTLDQLDKVAGRIWNAGLSVNEIDKKFGIIRVAQGTDHGLLMDHGAVIGMVVINRPELLDQLKKLGFTIQGDPNSSGMTAWSPESWRPMRNDFDSMNPKPPVGAGCPASQADITKVVGADNIMLTLTQGYYSQQWNIGLKVSNLNPERIKLYQGCGWTLQGDNPTVKSMYAPDWLRPLPTN